MKLHKVNWKHVAQYVGSMLKEQRAVRCSRWCSSHTVEKMSLNESIKELFIGNVDNG